MKLVQIIFGHQKLTLKVGGLSIFRASSIPELICILNAVYSWLSIGSRRKKKSAMRCQKLRAGWIETLPDFDSQRS